MKSHDTYNELKLKEAFIDLVLTKGYPATTVRSLTDLAGVSRTQFYNYYSDKADLAEDICYYYLDLHNSILSEYILHISEKRSDQLINKAFDTIRRDADIIRALWSIEEPSFSPYYIMQQSVCDTVLRYIAEDPSKASFNQQCFTSWFAACVMSTIKIFLDSECDNQQKIISNVRITLFDGMSKLLK